MQNNTNDKNDKTIITIKVEKIYRRFIILFVPEEQLNHSPLFRTDRCKRWEMKRNKNL